MPQFSYRGRDKEGVLHTGHRFANTVDKLNQELVREGIVPIQINITETKRPFWHKFMDWFQGETLRLEELAIFARQMQLLHQAGVPMVTALRQLASFMRSRSVAHALEGVIENLEKGQDLATSMEQYPDVFKPLMVNIIRIGERTGHLTEAFAHLHKYLEFEAHNIKQIKAAFRYPIFVLISIGFAIIVLNVFVIPTFARFYTNANIDLPWQTSVLIFTSNIIINYGWLILILLGIAGFYGYRYLHTPVGQYRWHKFQLQIPFVGKMIRRIILIRFSQTLAIVLNAGIPVNQGLTLVKDILQNSYINQQITEVQELIERGNSFSQSLTRIDLFTTLELQILAVGEKNGELGPALSYIGNFHGHEIEYDLKRMNDIIGPLLIGIVSLLILIIALGVYLPIWNMVSAPKT